MFERYRDEAEVNTNCMHTARYLFFILIMATNPTLQEIIKWYVRIFSIVALAVKSRQQLFDPNLQFLLAFSAEPTQLCAEP